jgi:hypothetical protein
LPDNQQQTRSSTEKRYNFRRRLVGDGQSYRHRCVNTYFGSAYGEEVDYRISYA